MSGVASGCRHAPIAAALLCAILSVAGCGDDRASMILHADAYGDRWPLRAAEARLYCGRDGERYIAVEGTNYALNGKALRVGMPRPDPVLKDPTVFALADFIERAGEICNIN